MYPTIDTLLGFGPAIDTHSAFVLLGLIAAGVIYWWELRRRGVSDPRMPWLVIGALAGGSIMARLGTWVQHLDFSQNLPFTEHMIRGNASILSGLVGAWLGVHIAKKIVGYRERTGDYFAPAVCAALILGRIGCLLTENPGAPTRGGWGIVLTPEQAEYTGSAAGVGLHPSFVYEIAFHAIMFVVLWFWLRHSRLAPGEMLTVYIGAYAVFRFFVEFVRANEVAFLGLTRPQMFLIVTIPLFAARIMWLARRGRLLVPRAAVSSGPNALEVTA
ncbi:prolipoprotein diacylglyceryl transferase [Microbacterium sp. NC79]|uniref:prolipoprotein diacylglyceryl transferase n=1 Tax=Microbacterium sp. NC79 TaxID=2851009 RepID=UPI001C2C6985|nr:prolipoprotein diacylglyceryl transferase family protein [Microbacterium sp. NC79]MBV0896062.1 prolipoprotein diacylglyceryl transferase [Microbacterium sp. NC79]